LAKLKIAIAVKDEAYGRKLAEYIPHHYSPEAEAQVWPAKEKGDLAEAADQTEADIFLLEENLVLPQETSVRAGVVITLTEELRNLREIEGVYKYQCADALLNQALRIYAQKHPDDPPLTLFNRKTRTVALFSAGGGEGKTTLAAALSIQAAWEGKRIFYLNLENTASTPLYFAGEQANTLSNTLYALCHHSQVREKVASAICTDPVYRIDFFREPDSLLDLQENPGGDLGLLVRLLAETGRYDRLFIDLSGGITHNYLAVLDACDKILLVSTEDRTAELKTQKLLREFKMLERSSRFGLLNKTRLILNKTKENSRTETGELPGEEAFAGAGIGARVPWTSDLTVACGERIRPGLDGPFGAAIHKLNYFLDD
jgi:cellulose biosynthesis protein BcsQ